MNRTSLVFALVSCAAIASADTGDSKTFKFNGSANSEIVDLSGAITHTETRQQQVSSTCYRNVFSHYSSVCHSVPRRVCDRYSTFSVEGLMNLLLPTAVADQRPPRGGGDRGGQRPGGGDRGGQRPGGGGGAIHRPPGGGGGRPGGENRPHPGGQRPGGRPGGGGEHRPRPPAVRPPDHRPPVARPPIHRPPVARPPVHRPPVVRPPIYRPPVAQCRTVYEQDCDQVAQYRTEAYSCTKTNTVSYSVKDADVSAKVAVQFGEVPAQVRPDDTFTVSLRGKEVSLSSKGTNQVVYFLEKSEDAVANGSLVESKVTYKVSMVPTAAINAPVAAGLNGLSLTSDAIRFTIGQVAYAQSLKIGLTLEREKTGSDKVLIKRDLTTEEYTLTNEGDKTIVEIDVAKLALSEKLEKGEFEIDVAARLDVQGQVANPSAISKAKVSKNAKIKLK